MLYRVSCGRVCQSNSEFTEWLLPLASLLWGPLHLPPQTKTTGGPLLAFTWVLGTHTQVPAPAWPLL